MGPPQPQGSPRTVYVEQVTIAVGWNPTGNNSQQLLFDINVKTSCFLIGNMENLICFMSFGPCHAEKTLSVSASIAGQFRPLQSVTVHFNSDVVFVYSFSWRYSFPHHRERPTARSSLPHWAKVVAMIFGFIATCSHTDGQLVLLEQYHKWCHIREINTSSHVFMLICSLPFWYLQFLL